MLFGSMKNLVVGGGNKKRYRGYQIGRLEKEVLLLSGRIAAGLSRRRQAFSLQECTVEPVAGEVNACLTSDKLWVKIHKNHQASDNPCRKKKAGRRKRHPRRRKKEYVFTVRLPGRRNVAH